MFLFPQSGCAGTDLPRGIGFGEWEIYILAKEYFFAKVIVFAECEEEWMNGKFEQTRRNKGFENGMAA